MPISRVSTSSLQPGLSRLAQAFAGGNTAYDHGFQQQLLAQSTLGKSIAQARLDNSKADEVDQQLAARQPDAILNSVLQGNNVPLDAAPDVQEYQRTGKISKFTPLPEGTAGPVLPEPEWTKNLGAIGRQIMSLNNALTLGDKNSENVAKASGEYRNQNLGDRVLNGDLSPLAVAASQYAVSGKAPYSFHEFGTGNNLTGEVDASGVPAQNFAGLRVAETGKNNAQAGAAKAAAANSYASAGQHSAQTRKINQDFEMGSKGVLRDTDQGLVLVDPRTGTSKPVYGTDGAALGPKLKDIPTQANTSMLTNSQNLRKVDRALALVTGQSIGDAQVVTKSPNGDAIPPTVNPRFDESGRLIGGMRVDKAATGIKGMLPFGAANYLDPKGVDARAEIADIGSLILHDRSGAAVTASETPRLVPFIPLPSDDAKTIEKKLRRFKQVYEEENNALQETYGPNNGYKQSSLAKKPAATAKPITVDY